MRKNKAEDILKFIETYISENGIAPSVREISAGTGLRSTSTIHRYLHQMQDEGILRMDSTKKRAIFLNSSAPAGIPVIGEVKSKESLTDEQNVISYVSAYPKTLNPVFAFYLTHNYPVLGFQNGDLLIAEYTQDLQEGRLTVFLGKNDFLEITAGTVPADCYTLGNVISMIRHF